VAFVRLDTRQFDRRMRKLLHATDNLSTPFTAASGEVTRLQSDAWNKMTYRSLYLGPQVYRTKVWREVRPMYIRQDGTRIPPWGGVPKVVGRGNVKGRKRARSRRLKSGDIVGRDTGNMFRQWTKPVVKQRSVTFSVRQLYGRYQEKLRSFAYLTTDDKRIFVSEVGRYLRELMRKAS
jgi:hypothetical protein